VVDRDFGPAMRCGPSQASRQVDRQTRSRTAGGTSALVTGLLPGDLAIGEDVWPAQPEAIRAGVLAMVKAAWGREKAR